MLWLPPSEENRLAEGRRQHNAEIIGQVALHKTLDEWNQALKEIDPLLMIVKAPEHAAHPILKPGYYHVIRENPGAPASLIVHEGPNGEFLEPDSSLLERLRKGDMWNDRAMHEATKREKKLQKAAESRRAQEKEDRIDELMERIKVWKNPSVLVGSKPW